MTKTVNDACPTARRNRPRGEAGQEAGNRQQDPQRNRIVAERENDRGTDDESADGSEDRLQSRLAGAEGVGSQSGERSKHDPESMTHAGEVQTMLTAMASAMPARGLLRNHGERKVRWLRRIRTWRDLFDRRWCTERGKRRRFGRSTHRNPGVPCDELSHGRGEAQVESGVEGGTDRSRCTRAQLLLRPLLKFGAMRLAQVI